MSAATTPPNVTHLPYTAHPIPLREQAFTLHCQGLRSPAIAQELGVPERTVRAWIAAALDDLKDDIQLSRREQLLLAVERQHQLTAACWQQFEHEAAARDALLDAALQTLRAAADAPEHPITVHLPASSLAPRYLSLILQAGKEANRLLGLHTIARLQLLATDSPNIESFPRTTRHIPAESATAGTSTLDAGNVGVSGWTPSEGDSHSPAESATASTPLCSSVSSVVNPPVPAESATAITDLDIPAESATAPAPAAPLPAFRPSTERAPAFQGRESLIPAESATDAPLSPQGEGLGVRICSPAESATHTSSSSSASLRVSS